jgi:Flp pilus assembly protein TadB
MPELHKTTLQKGARELGASRFSFLLLLAFTAAIFYLVVAFVPAYMGNQRMQEAAEQIIHRAATQNLSEADTRAQIHEKAREYGLPDDHNVDIRRDGKAMTASVTYTRMVRFPFYTYKWPVVIRVKDLGF